jgi:hypothetical protein
LTGNYLESIGCVLGRGLGMFGFFGSISIVASGAELMRSDFCVWNERDRA